jgi:hypothetical protein
MRLLFKAAFLFVLSIAAQSISTVLPQQNGLTTFAGCISQFPGFLAQLDAENFTRTLRHVLLCGHD